jgi:hypothetical protein
LIDGASSAVAALCASDAPELVSIVRVWMTMARADATAPARIATAEDNLRAAAEAIGVGGGAASLIAVAFTLA